MGEEIENLLTVVGFKQMGLQNGLKFEIKLLFSWCAVEIINTEQWEGIV